MNSETDPLPISRLVQLHSDAAAQRDIKLFIGFDFQEYVSITRGIPTKGRISPNFRPDRSPIKSGEGYWIIGVNQNEVALSYAARLYDLSQTNFAEHLESLKAFYGDPSIHAHPQDRCACAAPSAKKMTGKVAYGGDLWVRRDLRGGGMAELITRTAHGVSFALWAPDFVCALAARWRVDKGNVSQYTHHEPGGAILRLVEEDIVGDEWLIWLTGDELRSRLDEPIAAQAAERINS
ncbi:hypothetical protein N2603_38300 [Bradyrhizobium huanghuaihaiense]|uniref:hypothetical protein n=1 Tax=Bradyrhizobium huanghuaihaiense TaxID=990078 RepID=UPI0021AACCC6|nr:hypothetical protein [Bradyrhizobium sp. CB3035]UWU75773.1 hypothetical protein N2603_38300 [Bradyrhizobium sp. CB3035]